MPSLHTIKNHCFLFKGSDDVNDAELARKLHENEKGLRTRRQTTQKPVVSLCYTIVFLYYLSLGSRDGAVVRALASHQCGPGDSRSRRHMWVEFVVGSLLCSERFFSGYSGFPLSAKTNTFQIPIRSGYTHVHVLTST